jgi:hypothetical protein
MECAWTDLLEAIRKATDLDMLIRAHDLYLKQVSDKALMGGMRRRGVAERACQRARLIECAGWKTRERVLVIMVKIFDLIVNFCALQHRLHQSAAEEVRAVDPEWHARGTRERLSQATRCLPPAGQAACPVRKGGQDPRCGGAVGGHGRGPHCRQQGNGSVVRAHLQQLADMRAVRAFMNSYSSELQQLEGVCRSLRPTICGMTLPCARRQVPRRSADELHASAAQTPFPRPSLLAAAARCGLSLSPLRARARAVHGLVFTTLACADFNEHYEKLRLKGKREAPETIRECRWEARRTASCS